MIKKFTFNSTTLKIIAMILILVDHIGYFFIPANGPTAEIYLLLRGIGRLGFPLYAFFIVEGIIYTKDVGRYLLRLLYLTLAITIFRLVAILSPLGNYFYIGSAYNIFLTLLTGAATIAYFHKKLYKHIYLLLPILAMITTNILSLFVDGKWQIVLVNEYRFYGIMLILGFYIARLLTPKTTRMIAQQYQGGSTSIMSPDYQQKINNYLSSISLLFVNLLWYILSVTSSLIPFDAFQTYAIFTGILILVYNGNKGYQPIWFRWVYYLYYPVHLALLAVISLLIS